MKKETMYIGEILTKLRFSKQLNQEELAFRSGLDRTTISYIETNHIHRTNSFYRKTNVKFKNGFNMLVHSKLASFNNKLKIAEQYQEMTVEAGKNPTAFLLESKTIQLILSHLLVFKFIAEILEIIC